MLADVPPPGYTHKASAEQGGGLLIEPRLDHDKAEMQSDHELYNELSYINNELVNVQRQLVQKNLELEQLAAENARLYSEAQELLQMQNALHSILTHDLKSPLSAIIGYSQLLVRQVTRQANSYPPTILTGLQRIETTATKMTNQINGLLEIARLQRGEDFPLELQTIDLVALIQHVSAELQPASMQPQITVKSDVPVVVGQWDVSLLERMLDNLLSNAIKYSPDGGNITVEVGVEEATDALMALAVIRVQDQGLGIPASDIPHIFEPFRRAKNTTGRIEGTGIGLFSVRHIVEQHGGSISVESEEFAGTTFTVKLPLNPVAPAPGTS